MLPAWDKAQGNAACQANRLSSSEPDGQNGEGVSFSYASPLFEDVDPEKATKPPVFLATRILSVSERNLHVFWILRKKAARESALGRKHHKKQEIGNLIVRGTVFE